MALTSAERSRRYDRAHPERATRKHKKQIPGTPGHTRLLLGNRRRYNKWRRTPQGKVSNARKTRKRRADRRSLLNRLKSVPCADCGLCYPSYVMHFDHVRGEKEFNLARAAAAGFNLAKTLREVAKCEVVCANCHSERTWGKRE